MSAREEYSLPTIPPGHRFAFALSVLREKVRESAEKGDAAPGGFDADFYSAARQFRAAYLVLHEAAVDP